VTFLILRTQDTSLQTSASIAADVLSFVGTAAAAILSFLDHRRSLRPSTLLSLYLSVVILLGIARVRTLWLIAPGNPAPGVFTAVFALFIVALGLESMEDNKTSTGRPGGEKSPGAPEEYSGFWNRTIYAWLASTLRLGYKQVISVEDLPSLDTGLQSEGLGDKLESTWAKCKYPAMFLPSSDPVTNLSQMTITGNTVCSTPASTHTCSHFPPPSSRDCVLRPSLSRNLF
jgi:ATP-binding cassette, subfamily C (CFTR/MRP), member 1